MVENICNSIFDLLFILGKIIFCISLLLIIIPLVLIIFILLMLLIVPTGLIVKVFGLATTYDLNCPPGTPLNRLLSPIKSIYTLTDLNDGLEIDSKCPCLEE